MLIESILFIHILMTGLLLILSFFFALHTKLPFLNKQRLLLGEMFIAIPLLFVIFITGAMLAHAEFTHPPFWLIQAFILTGFLFLLRLSSLILIKKESSVWAYLTIQIIFWLCFAILIHDAITRSRYGL